MSEPWYIESFREDYLKIYAHRTDEAAKAEVGQIIDLFRMKPGSIVLDLCCGNGRHSRALSASGFNVTGIDLSEVLLREAKRKSMADTIRYIHQDVRDLQFNEEFDYVLNLFTSFGYFEQAEENIKVFESIHNALKRNGEFLIDFLNPPYLKQHLVPRSVRKVGELEVIERRRIEGKKVMKEIEVHDEKGVRTYHEQVNLFSLEEMKVMLLECRLHVTDVYGNFDQQDYKPQQSPRMIIVGKK